MKRIVRIVLLIALVGAGGYLAWWYRQRANTSDELALYGNVDLRQVELAFNNSQRIAEVRVQEGDRVRRGDILARLDVQRLEPQVAQVAAQVAAQRQVVERLQNGSRPEEIAQARANLDSSKADAANAKRQNDRLEELSTQSMGGAVSQQDLDNASAVLSVANAKVEVNQKALELALAGPRKEEVAEAEARLRANEAQLALLKQELADANLVAPVDAVVRTRIMEPGEMASPQRPVLLLAVVDPKWIRAYVTETKLGKVRLGGKAEVKVDSFPDRRFSGWVGFVSPVAEFTPKTVQTEELRTSLVYEVRVFVNDPKNELHLGMPATVLLDLEDPEAASQPKAAPAETKSEPAETNPTEQPMAETPP